MTDFTRGTALTGAAAATIAPLAAPVTEAAAPPANMQAPGVYRYKVGTVEVTVLTDGARWFPLNANYVNNAPLDDVKKALAEINRPTDKFVHHYAPIVVNTGPKLVLIDTGSGPGAFTNTKGELGQLPQNLQAAGIRPQDIDVVVISHFHADHVSGLLDADSKLAFPNAEVMVPAGEWKFWMDDGEMSRAPAGRMANLFKNNRRVFDALGRKATQYDWNKEVAPGITSIATLGHCIGHTSFVIASGSDTVYVQSDVTNNPDLFARRPQWSASFDQDPQLAVATRKKVYDMLVTDRMKVQGFHYPFPGLAHVEKAGDGYRVAPLPWMPTI